MNRVVSFVLRGSYRAKLLVLALALLAGALAALGNHRYNAVLRQAALDIDAQRQGLALMSQTLNGQLMGSVALLGLVDADIKHEALGQLKPGATATAATFGIIGPSLDADGVFLVGQDGIVQSSWDRSGKPSTGTNVKFRPYYKMALQGQSNVYAAVSLATGERSLYFAAPVFGSTSASGAGIGAVVARSRMDKLDNLIGKSTDIALLLSPQGVVFASSRASWLGALAGQASPERLKTIRELKQFGKMFEASEPPLLPISVARGRLDFEGLHYVVATAPVLWNDAAGDWSLVLLEDLARTVPLAEPLWVGAAASLLVLLLGWMGINMLRSRQAQTLATQQLQAFASAQEASVQHKSKLAAASLRFQTTHDAHELARVFFLEARNILGAVQGLMYMASTQPESPLQLIGSAACSGAVPEQLLPGEGLLGQCALERRLQVIEMPDDGCWAIRSGLGQLRPAALLLSPILLQDSLLGVLELAVLAPPEPIVRAQFDEMVALLAINLEIVRRNLPLQMPVATSTDTLETAK